jgi:mono/diheme cytochrome c family protein
MRTRLVLAAALLACAGSRPRPAAGELVFQVSGRVEHGPHKFGKDDLPKLTRRGFEAVAPQTGEKAKFEGVALADLLSREVEVMRDADVALVHGRGGIAVIVPLAAIRQLRPVLADKVDGEATRAWRADAGTLLLSWPNREQPGIDTDPRMRWWWVPGVIKVELVDWIPTYGRALRVPPGAGDEARLGADVLQGSCLNCHKLRGVGGTRGPELKDELVVKDPAAFRTLLADHLAKVSGLASAPETTPGQARSVAAFLRAVEIAGAGRPDEEIKEKPPLPPPGRSAPPTRGY